MAAQVTLQGGAADPQAIRVLLNTAASQGIIAKPEPGAHLSDRSGAVQRGQCARGSR